MGPKRNTGDGGNNTGDRENILRHARGETDKMSECQPIRTTMRSYGYTFVGIRCCIKHCIFIGIVTVDNRFTGRQEHGGWVSWSGPNHLKEGHPEG